MQKDLNQKIGQATKWSGITEIATKLISPLTNAILARILVPEMFGVVATLTMAVSFAEIFTDAGFQKYIVQHEFADKDDLNLSTNVAFWTNLAFSVAIWAIIAIFATPISNLVGSQGHETAIILMSLEIPMLAFSSIQMARYRRDFDFKNLFIARMVVSLVPLVVTVPVALLLKNYWALIIGTLAKDIMTAVSLTVRSKWKPQFRYSVQKLKEMISFSFWTMIENVTIWLTSNADIFIIGSIMSAYYLGLFKTTITTANGYMNIISSATAPVLFAALSRCQNDKQEFAKVFLKFQRMVAILILPLGIGLFLFRNLATQILLGSQWEETADFLGLWFLTSAFTTVFNNYNSEAFRSMGKPKLSILVQVLHLAALIPVLLWGVHQAYSVLTVARAVVRIEIVLVSAIVLHHFVGIHFTSVVKNVWPSMISSVIMAIVGMCLQQLFDSILWQFCAIAICVVVYAGSMLLIPAGRRQVAEIPIFRRLLHLK